MATEGERLATVEAVLRELRDDVHALGNEIQSARTRLHNLEGISSTFLAWQKDARDKEAAQYRRLGRWIGVLTVVVALAALVEPLLAHLTYGG